VREGRLGVEATAERLAGWIVDQLPEGAEGGEGGETDGEGEGEGEP
jgi:hypothetical protein